MNRKVYKLLVGMKGKVKISTVFGTSNLGKHVCDNIVVQHKLGLKSSAYSKSVNSTKEVTSAAAISEKSKDVWDLCVGLLVERKPIITSENNAMENKYVRFLNQYEIELSKKSDHEMRLEKDLVIQDKVKSGEIDQGTIQTAQDFEDTSSAELNEFVYQSRLTEADVNKDCKSLQRAIDSHLVLLVHQKLGTDLKWVLPQTKRLEGETLRQVAERIVLELYPDRSLKVLSNAPWGFYKYKYPAGLKTEGGKSITGAKVFFYKAHIPADGEKTSVKQGSAFNINDYMWLTHSELKSKLGENYCKSVSDILIS